MTFIGVGLVWNPKKNKLLCSFSNGKEYETNDPCEKEILKSCPQAECTSDEIAEVKEKIKKTRKQLVLEAKEAGITGADRMKTEDIISKLEG